MALAAKKYENESSKLSIVKNRKQTRHRRNPFSTHKQKYYLDKNGNPVKKNSKQSHIYTNCQ